MTHHESNKYGKWNKVLKEKLFRNNLLFINVIKKKVYTKIIRNCTDII